jgi:transketolase C-terminal domain/subunit
MIEKKKQTYYEEQRLIIINENHKIVNGLHCILEDHLIEVYTDKEYKAKNRRKKWNKFIDTLKEMARGASYAINK